MNAVSHTAFRLAILALAVVLALQCFWLVLPQLLRPAVDRLPTDASAAATTAKMRSAAAWAATIGIIRGDLWAESAYTYSDLLWGNADLNGDRAQALQRARARLDRALRDAPHQSSAWLFRAALGLRYPSNDINPVESIRMSYYTGPSEQDLMPLRLRMVMHLNIAGDVEIRQLASRDLRSLIARKQIAEIAAAYSDASPAGKSFIEQAVRDIDPAMTQLLRSGANQLSVPN